MIEQKLILAELLEALISDAYGQISPWQQNGFQMNQKSVPLVCLSLKEEDRELFSCQSKLKLPI